MNTNQAITIRADKGVAVLKSNFLFILGDALGLILAAEEVDLITRHTVHGDIVRRTILTGAALEEDGTEITAALGLFLGIEIAALYAGNDTAHLEGTALLRKVKNSICHVETPLCIKFN